MESLLLTLAPIILDILFGNDDNSGVVTEKIIMNING